MKPSLGLCSQKSTRRSERLCLQFLQLRLPLTDAKLQHSPHDQWRRGSDILIIKPQLGKVSNIRTL